MKATLRLWNRRSTIHWILPQILWRCDVNPRKRGGFFTRPFKHALKVAYHSWLVETLLLQRSKGKRLDLDTKVGVLRDASVGWIWEGYKAIGNKELIKKV
jgi:hypothetical protein